MTFDITALTTLIGSLVWFGVWLFVGHRLNQSQSTTLKPVHYLNRFFLHMGIFFIIMFVPHLALSFSPANFPLWMALGYTFGHIFLYTAFINVALMTVSIVPRLAGKERLVVILGSLLTIFATTATFVTMVLGTRPAYDYTNHVTLLNAAPIVGACIGLTAILTVMPSAVLFLINAVKNPARRTRSLLLGIGFIIMVAAGPLHDVARTWQVYVTADIFTIVCILLIGAGVLYRLDQSLSLAQQQPSSTPNPAA